MSEIKIDPTPHPIDHPCSTCEDCYPGGTQLHPNGDWYCVTCWPRIPQVAAWTICICGPRTLTDPEVIRAAMHYVSLTGLTPETIAEVVSGAAKGADLLGEQWAAEHGIPVRRFPADWSRHGRRAGPIRNAEMVAYLKTKLPEAAVVAIDTGSSGTADMMRRSEKAGIQVVAYRQELSHG